MTPSPMFLSRLLFIFVLVQSVSLYKIYAADNDRSDLLDRSINSRVAGELRPMKTNGFNDADESSDADEDLDSWVPSVDERNDQRASLWKRSASPLKARSSIPLPQRRNSRPHWNPVVAAYKRCGHLSAREERETCFKDAIQMLFVHKLRK